MLDHSGLEKEQRKDVQRCGGVRQFRLTFDGGAAGNCKGKNFHSLLANRKSDIFIYCNLISTNNNSIDDLILRTVPDDI